MPTPKQIMQQLTASGGSSPVPSVWFWQGFSSDGLGNVAAADGSVARGVVSGNELPGFGDAVSFVPGNPIGQVFVRQFVGSVEQPISAGRASIFVLDRVNNGSNIEIWLSRDNFQPRLIKTFSTDDTAFVQGRIVPFGRGEDDWVAVIIARSASTPPASSNVISTYTQILYAVRSNSESVLRTYEAQDAGVLTEADTNLLSGLQASGGGHWQYWQQTSRRTTAGSTTYRFKEQFLYSLDVEIGSSTYEWEPGDAVTWASNYGSFITPTIFNPFTSTQVGFIDGGALFRSDAQAFLFQGYLTDPSGVPPLLTTGPNIWNVAADGSFEIMEGDHPNLNGAVFAGSILYGVASTAGSTITLSKYVVNLNANTISDSEQLTVVGYVRAENVTTPLDFAVWF